MAVSPIILLYITAKDKQEASNLAKALLEERLIACANILPEMESIFRWEGEIQIKSEVLLLAKTTQNKLDAAILKAGELHSYEYPAIIALPIESAHFPFAKWVNDEIKD